MICENSLKNSRNLFLPIFIAAIRNFCRNNEKGSSNSKRSDRAKDRLSRRNRSTNIRICQSKTSYSKNTRWYSLVFYSFELSSILEYNSFANRLRKLRAMRDELKMSGDPEKSELEKEELTLANKAVELELTEIYEANRRIAIDFDYNKVKLLLQFYPYSF